LTLKYWYATILYNNMMTEVKNLDQFINDFLADFTPKQARVLRERFGLKNGIGFTLQEIGDGLGITRERVRQIEEQCIKKLRPKIQEKAGDVLNFSYDALDKAGGVRKDDVFMKELKNGFGIDGKVKFPEQKLRFVFWMGSKPSFRKEDDDNQSFWYTTDEAKDKYFAFAKQMSDFFENNDKLKVLNDKTYLNYCKDDYSCHLLTVSKKFGSNIFGDIGLKVWPEINPRTVRDKIYLVLKRENKPLHFETIAKTIGSYGFDKRKANMQTVHNELIKDNRFILVGRGMYGLRENGYESGTVKDLIVSLLKNKGPLPSQEIVDFVNQQRFLKENTILLSLQNRRFFKKLDDGRYHTKAV